MQDTQAPLAVIKRGFDAFAVGDIPTLSELFHDDASWTGQPSGILTNDYRGRDAILGFFGTLMQETGGTYTTAPTVFAASGDKVFVETRVRGSRKGRSIDAKYVFLFDVVNGRVRTVEEYASAVAETSAFWAA